MKTTCRTNIPSEEQEQIAVADYLRLRGVVFNHSPNEGKREPQYIVKLKRLGMRVGFPDIFIYEARGKYHGLAIELKRQKGGKISKPQLQCLCELKQRGYYATVCRGFQEAKIIIDKYLKGELQ